MLSGNDFQIETGVAAVVFATTFLLGDRFRPFRSLFKNPRTLISLGAGMSVAYVFLHLMPELHEARSTFVASVSMTLRYEGKSISFLSLLGFLTFYGLTHLSARFKNNVQAGEAGLSFKLQISGFAAYIWLMSYLLVHSLAPGHGFTTMYAVAMTFHFLALDYNLRHEHAACYMRIGRFVLAGAVFLGWSIGQLYAIPHHILALLVAFISGAIIMTSTVMELSSGEDSRYLPFVCGAIIYGLILIPLG
jgi:hypothetical protein